MRPKLPIGQRDSVVGAVADRQYGVVSREQLLRAGLQTGQIKRAVHAGRLRPVFRGVYAVGHEAIGRHGWWKAALLVGDAADLSHRSAAQAWSFNRGPVHPIHLTSLRDCGRGYRNLHIHRSRLKPTEHTIIDGLRLTTPARTIVDLAATLDPRALRLLVERAQDLRRFSPKAIEASLTLRPRRPGCAQLRDLVHLLLPDEDNARSHLERLFLSLLRRSSLPKPEVNVVINGRRRDFVWHAARLVVETDGYAYHSSKAAMLRDRRRDRELTAAGWRVARFTYEEVAFEPGRVAEELVALLGR